MAEYRIGQRWASEMEPELGIGIVEAFDGRRLQLTFPDSNLTRLYAAQDAPLRRVVFQAGDRIASSDGVSLTVASIEAEDGQIVYCGDGLRFREDMLAGNMMMNTPMARLMAGQQDSIRRFDLRIRILEYRRRTVRSMAYGFMGGRVDLIFHQFATAADVCSRRRPRVLLADETGLGKTIEAGLILHRLAITGQVSRVLVIVPDALVVQWFVELARRFNMRFRLFDQAFAADQPPMATDENVFDDAPFGLCGYAFLRSAPPVLLDRLVNGAWDMVVVDEAHHIQPGGTLFTRVERLSHAVERMILITATPGQLAAPSHFTRLRLLDPDRYPDYGQFRRETGEFEQTANIVRALKEGGSADPEAQKRLANMIGLSAEAIRCRLSHADGRQQLIRSIVDLQGTGRVMFKATRNEVTGFPGRTVQIVPLDTDDGQNTIRHRINREIQQDCGLRGPDEDFRFDQDPRASWLTALLRRHRDEKFLLICRTSAKVEALVAEVTRRININVGRYHEKMTLVQRDRQAAWFAEPDGAVMLVCSEIGSEGRNFQFASNLVLFDLPPDADLLAQRIGRLDRIGQKGIVQVMVPCVCETAGMVLARWYQEALNAFVEYKSAADWVTRRFWRPLSELIASPDGVTASSHLDRLIHAGRVAAARRQRKIVSGRDRLLEWGAMPSEKASDLLEEVRVFDNDPDFPQIAERLLDVWGIVMEPVEKQIFQLTPDHRYADPLPGFRPAGMAVTTDRAIALSREDLGLITWDHPLIIGAMEQFFGKGVGSVNFVQWEAQQDPCFYLEMIYVLEVADPPGLYLQAFLPPTAIRVVVDQHGDDGGSGLPDGSSARYTDGSISLLRKLLPLISHQMRKMVDEGGMLARSRAAPVVAAARQSAAVQLNTAVKRLDALRRVNAAIGDSDVDAARQDADTMLRALSNYGLRLDAIRLIVKGKV